VAQARNAENGRTFAGLVTPKELREETEVEVHESADGVPSVKLHLKRESPTINNYSPNLISVWRANMDIQLVGNAYGAAEYTAAYVSKAEPDTLRFKRVIDAAVKRCDPNLPNQAIFKRVANSTLSIREVSAQESVLYSIEGTTTAWKIPSGDAS
jgi:hypothetical protein